MTQRRGCAVIFWTRRWRVIDRSFTWETYDQGKADSMMDRLNTADCSFTIQKVVSDNQRDGKSVVWRFTFDTNKFLEGVLDGG